MPTSRDLSRLTMRELGLKAIGLRNRRDAFRHGSPHADEYVQELALVERELRRRREQATNQVADELAGLDLDAALAQAALDDEQRSPKTCERCGRELPVLASPCPSCSADDDEDDLTRLPGETNHEWNCRMGLA